MSRRTPSRPRRVTPSRRPRASEAPAAATGREVDIDITSIAAGGDGVGRADGVVVFTPRTAPGDRVRVRAVPARGGRLARGTLVDLLQTSPERVEPVCVHYTRDRCGGCQLQHLRYEAQLEAKGEIVGDALTRIARRPTERVAVRPSPTQWRYRRKLTLAIRRSASGQWTGGLHRYRRARRDLPARRLSDHGVGCDRGVAARAASRGAPARRLRIAGERSGHGRRLRVRGRGWPSMAARVAIRRRRAGAHGDLVATGAFRARESRRTEGRK